MRRIDCDNKILQALSLYADLMLLSALWLLTSLPLVTAGASTAALYGVLLKLASGRDETGVVRAFSAAGEWSGGGERCCGGAFWASPPSRARTSVSARRRDRAARWGA